MNISIDPAVLDWRSFVGNHIIWGDCLAFMRSVPDDHFDLAPVDPPYGINAGEMQMGSGKNKQYKKGYWDNAIPPPEYFTELFRISKNQIIFGGNYFPLPITRSWLFWDKGINGDSSFADGELAWTSFDQVLRKINVRYKGFLGADDHRIHITQKPIKLYAEILRKYAKPGDRILDTHGGSMSSVIAAIELGFDIVCLESDQDHYNDAVNRVKNHFFGASVDLFRKPPVIHFATLQTAA